MIPHAIIIRQQTSAINPIIIDNNKELGPAVSMKNFVVIAAKELNYNVLFTAFMISTVHNWEVAVNINSECSQDTLSKWVLTLAEFKFLSSAKIQIRYFGNGAWGSGEMLFSNVLETIARNRNANHDYNHIICENSVPVMNYSKWQNRVNKEGFYDNRKNLPSLYPFGTLSNGAKSYSYSDLLLEIESKIFRDIDFSKVDTLSGRSHDIGPLNVNYGCVNAVYQSYGYSDESEIVPPLEASLRSAFIADFVRISRNEAGASVIRLLKHSQSSELQELAHTGTRLSQHSPFMILSNKVVKSLIGDPMVLRSLLFLSNKFAPEMRGISTISQLISTLDLDREWTHLLYSPASIDIVRESVGLEPDPTRENISDLTSNDLLFTEEIVEHPLTFNALWARKCKDEVLRAEFLARFCGVSREKAVAVLNRTKQIWNYNKEIRPELTGLQSSLSAAWSKYILTNPSISGLLRSPDGSVSISVHCKNGVIYKDGEEIGAFTLPRHNSSDIFLAFDSGFADRHSMIETDYNMSVFPGRSQTLVVFPALQ